MAPYNLPTQSLDIIIALPHDTADKMILKADFLQLLE